MPSVSPWPIFSTVTCSVRKDGVSTQWNCYFLTVNSTLFKITLNLKSFNCAFLLFNLVHNSVKHSAPCEAQRRWNSRLTLFLVTSLSSAAHLRATLTISPIHTSLLSGLQTRDGQQEGEPLHPTRRSSPHVADCMTVHFLFIYLRADDTNNGNISN